MELKFYLKNLSHWQKLQIVILNIYKLKKKNNYLNRFKLH